MVLQIFVGTEKRTEAKMDNLLAVALLNSWSQLSKRYLLGSAIKNMGLFSKIPIDFKIETRDL